MRFLLIVLLIRFSESAPNLYELKSNNSDSRFSGEIDNQIVENKTNDDAKTFQTKYAQEVLSYMNVSVDPCDDFFEYACGNWINATGKRTTNLKRSNLEDIRYKLFEMIYQLMNKSPSHFGKYQNEFTIAKQYLESCLKADIYPIKPSVEYIKVLKDIGGFPAIDDGWDVNNFDWLNMTSYLSLYGVPSLVNEKIYPKHPFPPFFEMPTIGFDFQITTENFKDLNSDGYKINREMMFDLLKIYGVEGNKSEIIVGDILKLFRSILNLIDSVNENGECDSPENLLSSIWSTNEFNWNRYFDIAWQGANVTESDEFESHCPNFYNKLSSLLDNTSPKTIANYLSLKFLHYMHGDHKNTQDQIDFCSRRVIGSFRYLIGQLYVNEYFNREIELDILKIVSSLRESLRDLLSKATWLDEETREAALNKEEHFDARIGSIEDPILDEIINEINKLNMSDNFFENQLKMVRFYQENKRYPSTKNCSVQTKPLEMMQSIQVNAYYYVIDNSINVMAGILNQPVYHKHFPNSVKFSTLGYILGHEMTHAFDQMGANFDHYGNMNNWWTNTSEAEFVNRAECFETQYNQFKVTEIDTHINGKTTKDENIADNGGLREAFNAYLNVLKKYENRSASNVDTLPGLPLTNTQTFFLTFAQLYCSKYTKSSYWDEVTNEHTVDYFRVTGSLQNFDQFAKHYNCPLGSKMNPEKKCRVW